MKNLTTLVATLIVFSAIIYLIGSFIMWDFSWVKPSIWRNSERAGFIVTAILIQAFPWMIWDFNIREE